MAGYQFTKSSLKEIARIKRSLTDEQIEVLDQALIEISNNPFLSRQKPKAISKYNIPRQTAREYKLFRLDFRIIYTISRRQKSIDIYYIGLTRDAPGHH